MLERVGPPRLPGPASVCTDELPDLLGQAEGLPIVALERARREAVLAESFRDVRRSADHVIDVDHLISNPLSRKMQPRQVEIRTRPSVGSSRITTNWSIRQAPPHERHRSPCTTSLNLHPLPVDLVLDEEVLVLLHHLFDRTHCLVVADE